MAKRLVNVNDLWYKIHKLYSNVPEDRAIVQNVLNIIKDAPVVEDEDIVRCESCGHYERWADGAPMYSCEKYNGTWYPNDFCSNAVRKKI